MVTEMLKKHRTVMTGDFQAGNGSVVTQEKAQEMYRKLKVYLHWAVPAEDDFPGHHPTKEHYDNRKAMIVWLPKEYTHNGGDSPYTPENYDVTPINNPITFSEFIHLAGWRIL